MEAIKSTISLLRAKVDGKSFHQALLVGWQINWINSGGNRRAWQLKTFSSAILPTFFSLLRWYYKSAVRLFVCTFKDVWQEFDWIQIGSMECEPNGWNHA